MSASPSNPQPPMLAALREATADAHAALDSKLGNMTRERYTIFLRASYAVLVDLEPKITALVGAAPDGLSRVTALAEDLAALGVEPPPSMPTPPVASIAEAMGAAYVVEGSALGGIYIARALAPDLPRRYLTLRGDRSGPAFREAVNKIEAWAVGASISARATTCDTARATFDAYSHAFEVMGAFTG